ncbi:lipase family protein, partial [Genlisea aurea]
GVSSFNQFIHELSVDSDASSSSVEFSSDGEESDIHPASPLSQSSRISRDSSSSSKRNRTWIYYWIRFIVSWILFPVKFLFRLPLDLYTALKTWKGRGNPRSITTHSPRRLQSLRDHFVQRATDRRRGVVEDLHVAFEIFIEHAFEVAHKASRCLLSPGETFRRVNRWFSSNEASVPTSELANSDPSPVERKTTAIVSPLNTDARTCEDVITELGYPYEAIRVVTGDGYVLLLERIPRRDSRKVVFLQHGILDSSMGWVSNGVVGSPAFAAFDQGYDVFLGNFRGLVSRDHVDKNISSRMYWSYSINEHGTEDIPAMIEKIHEIKTRELDSDHHQPYKICAVCHSLGGAAILIYLITRRVEEKPHRLSRVILLSPAGFHHDSGFVFTAVEYLFLFTAPVLSRILPAFYIPTRFFRMLLNKLARDFHNLPAVGGLVQTLMSYFVGGDSSNWVGVLGLPHYNMNGMPGVSFRVALHLTQMKHSKKFAMFDYGSPAANAEVYGLPEPLDLGDYYGFIDVPVDLVAGRKDKVIKPSMVRKHYRLMKDAGVEVTYSEFEYAHLDFTFSHREELLSYVMSRLLLVVGPPSKQRKNNNNKIKPLKLKVKEEAV